MSDAVERLKWLCSPDAERLSDGERINQFVKYGLEAITELEQRIEFMGAIYRIHRGILAPRGGEWQATTVVRLLARLSVQAS
jgi:hypothetical protein